MKKSSKPSLHSLCRWTFHSGKGGFVPANMRKAWNSSTFGTLDMIELIKTQIKPRLPSHVTLGLEFHFDTEINDKDASEVADAMLEAGLYLAMITPGAHSHFAYGGVASLDARERKQAESLGKKTVDLAYGPLRQTWNPQAVPTFVLWNGSYGYDLATIGVKPMYQNLKESIADLCKYEKTKGEKLFFGIEPKPNEGHPAMLLPTVASTLLFWRRLEEEFGVSRKHKGVNKEFGHSEMIGLDHVYDTVEELDNDAMVHVHLNSQGYNDGIILGGPGKYDIDHGTRINGMNIAVAGLMQQSNYQRWKGHDMQVRAYDNETQAVDRVVRSILSWEACERAAAELDQTKLLNCLASRETAKAEDIMRKAVTSAFSHFDAMYDEKSASKSSKTIAVSV